MQLVSVLQAMGRGEKNGKDIPVFTGDEATPSGKEENTAKGRTNDASELLVQSGMHFFSPLINTLSDEQGVKK